MWPLAFFSLFALPSAFAATYDPDLQWKTLQTEHFNIHFHQGEGQLADEFSPMLEEVFQVVLAELQWEPRRRTELALIDRTDDANGFAMHLPYNTIVIYVTGPQEDSSLNFYEDWSSAIATHEYTHIVHLDTRHGIVSAVGAVLGRIASTNNISPPWMIEGLATFEETRQTSGGRGRTPLAEMIKRTAVLEDKFPPLGNLDGFQVDPPSGNLRYLFGQDFIQYIADHQGVQVWTRWIHLYGGHIPYLLPSKKAFGRQLVPLYFDWKKTEFEQYQGQIREVEALGLREGRMASLPEASCTAPSFSPDGENLVWSCYDLKTGSAIWMSDGQGYAPQILVKDRGAKDFTWRADSQAFVYAALHIVNRFNTWSDIYLYDLKGGVSPLSNGARARDPEFSPDGSRLMVVTNRVQNNQLEVLTVDRRRTPITAFSDHTQLSTPRYSPDGKAIALSVWQEGRRDLWLYSPEGQPLRRLTEDSAVDREPERSADGRWLFFCSERSGIPNIYAIEVETEHLWQVTNVRTGAGSPTLSPDGKLLAYEQYSHDGWEIRILDLDPQQYLDRGPLPKPFEHRTPISELTQPLDQPLALAPVALQWKGEEVTGKVMGVPRDPFPFGLQAPEETLDTFEQAKVKDVFGEEQEYPFKITPRRYNPLPTLLPSYLLPYLQTTPYTPSPNFRLFESETFPEGLLPALQGTLATGSVDTLRRYGWSASVSYRTDAEFIGWSANFTVNRFLPVYSVGALARAVGYGYFYTFDPDNPYDADGNLILQESSDIYWEKRTQAYAIVSYPYTARSTIFGQYTFTLRESLQDLPENTVLSYLPVRGTLGELGGGWRYAWSEQTAYAISLEDGRILSLVGSVMSPYLGSFTEDEAGDLQPLTQFQITGDLREYLVNPWIPNHVLAFRLGGGATFGQSTFLGSYQLGGNLGEGAFYLVPDEFRMIRGYPFAYDIGDMYWLGGVEYRFPVWRVDRGIGTIPAFARTISGALFLDSGNAFESLYTWEDAVAGALVGTGAEIRFSTVLGWGYGLTGRLGYAIGLTEGGFFPETPAEILDGLYFQFGGSF